MRIRHRAVVIIASVIGMTALLSVPAAAQRSAASAKRDSKKDAEVARAIAVQLTDKESSVVRTGFEALEEAGEAGLGAVPVANQVLSRGLPIDLSMVAVRVLGKVGDASSSAAIRPYLRHRHLPLRREAAKALVRTKGPSAKEGLRGALSDADPMVRGIAAGGLGELGAKEYIEDLFVALEHKVPEAAAAIGQLCDPEQCERFAGKTGRVGFDVMTSGFDQILFRDPSGMPDEAKLKIVGRIRELGTGEANRLLADVQGRWPATWSKRVKQAIDLAVLSTQGAPGARDDEGEE